MKNLRIILPAIAATLLCTMALARTTGKPQREKARQYYYEALRMDAAGKTDAAYELHRKSSHVDSTFSPNSFLYGAGRLMVNTDTLMSDLEMDRTFNMIRTYCEEYPGDVSANEYFAYLLSVVDMLPEAAQVMERVVEQNPNSSDSYVQLSRIYAKLERTEDAVKAVKEYEKLEGETVESASLRITYHLMANDTTALIGDIDDLARRFPDDINYLLLRGNVYMAIDRPDSAMHLYEVAERIDPQSSEVKLALAGIYREAGDSVSYDNKVYEALLLDDMDIDNKVEMLAEYLQNLMDNKESVARGDYLFSVLSKQYPHEASVLDLSARYNAAKGNYADAIEQIGYALDQDGANRNYWAQLMTYQIQADLYDDAEKSYERAAAAVEADEGLKLLHATIASLRKDYDSAVDIYQDLINSVAPQAVLNDSIDINTLEDLSFEQLAMLSSYYQYAGDAFYGMERIPQAYQAYENAIKIFPFNSMALNNYAYFLTENGGDLEKAKEMAESAFKMDPDNPTVIDTYAWIFFKTGDYEQAASYQKMAIEKAEADNSVSSDLYSHYGDILFKNGQPDEALEYWQKALDMVNENTPEKIVKSLHKKVEHKTYIEE